MSNEDTIRDHIEMIADAITSMLSECGDKGHWPIDRFMIGHNWARQDPRMRLVNDICEKYHNRYIDGEHVSWSAFEGELTRELGFVHYSEVKDLVLALWESRLWRDVCREYAKENRCSEFEDILNPE